MIELFFIIPYFFGKAMQNQQRKQVEQQMIQEYLQKKKEMEEAEAAKRAEEEEESEYESEDEYEMMVDQEINESGFVVDKDSGLVIGRLVEGNTETLAGKKVGEDGVIKDENGNVIGRVEPLEDSDDEEDTEDEKISEDDQYNTQETDLKIFQKKIEDTVNFLQQSFEKITPVLKTISWIIGCEERKPEEERDEKVLVDHIKLLIEQAFNILEEASCAIQELDLTHNTQMKTTKREASLEEVDLSNVLSQLLSIIIKTVDRAEKKVKTMPYTESQMNPQFRVLQSPLLNILSNVDHFSANVLGLVGNQLNQTGLGDILNSLSSEIGLNKFMKSLNQDNL
ncbi:hypothetical protein G6F56_003770 [Rhizopus delemar]|nr:hypothetical protein G6F56_003770 [Rhizopus delemar]